jgi:hypothetical protein
MSDPGRQGFVRELRLLRAQRRGNRALTLTVTFRCIALTCKGSSPRPNVNCVH